MRKVWAARVVLNVVTVALGVYSLQRGIGIDLAAGIALLTIYAANNIVPRGPHA